MTTAKIAISMPLATLRSLEHARRRLGRSRSALITEAVEAWLHAREVSEADRQYVEGYLRRPEPSREAASIAAAAVAAWESWR
jgi:metal-responsive CopG/Arc/MetJ family transcriptional regulator